LTEGEHEYVAVVGSREGVDDDVVVKFVTALWKKHPNTILVSGGAKGVDERAEQTWLALGGRVLSYRPKKLADEHYVIEVWALGDDKPIVYILSDFPSFADYKSAAFARDTLIAETAHRIVGFQRSGGSRGTQFTMTWGEESQPKPRYVMPCE
jgi:hypothetical protein